MNGNNYSRRLIAADIMRTLIRNGKTIPTTEDLQEYASKAVQGAFMLERDLNVAERAEAKVYLERMKARGKK